MSDVTQTTTTATPEAPLTNSPEARTPTGEIKDASLPPVEPQVEANKEVEASPKPVVPETYSDFRAPEGAALDPDLISKAAPIFKELGLTQDQAQKLVDFQAQFAVAKGKEMESLVTEMRKAWRDELSSDPSIGGKLEQVKVDIGRGLNSLGDPKLVSDFKAAMDLTGAGDHPAVVKALHRLAQAVNEGSHVTGSGPSQHGQVPNGKVAKPSPAQAMYPNLPS